MPPFIAKYCQLQFCTLPLFTTRQQLSNQRHLMTFFLCELEVLPFQPGLDLITSKRCRHLRDRVKYGGGFCLKVFDPDFQGGSPYFHILPH